MHVETLGDAVSWSPPDGDAPPSKHGQIFGKDVQLIVLTSVKHQQLARKVQTLYSPLVRRIMFVSDKEDKALNATVLPAPTHPKEWIARNPKEHPGVIYELLRMLADTSRFPHPAKFYLVMHDVTFPLLDQIKWKLERYRHEYKGAWPNFTGGRKTAHVYDPAHSTYWKEQADDAQKRFGTPKDKKLFAAPSYMVGFSAQFVQAVADFADVEKCPLLSSEGVALAGLLECAGGPLPRTEFDFITQTRSNHREKKIDKTDAPLSTWRQFDAFNGCNTPGMLQEAYDAYYGKLKIKPAAEGEPAAAEAGGE